MNLHDDLSVSTVKIRYFAYNTLEIKLPGGKTVVVDPCLIKEGRFSCGYDETILEGCDYVFLNHSHGDHAASLGAVYDRFHPLILAHEAVSFKLAQLYDIPFIRFIPFTFGNTMDFDDFKIQSIHGRHNSGMSGHFMVRPSGRADELCGSSPLKLPDASGLEREVGNLGTMYNTNFLMTLPNNLKIGFFAGNPGMTEPEDRNAWSRLRPDILFAHRAKYKDPEYAEKMSRLLEITGARILIPIHMEDAYKETYDVEAYGKNVNETCSRKGISGRMIFFERAQWYEFSTCVVKMKD